MSRSVTFLLEMKRSMSPRFLPHSCRFEEEIWRKRVFFSHDVYNCCKSFYWVALPHFPCYEAQRAKQPERRFPPRVSSEQDALMYTRAEHRTCGRAVSSGNLQLVSPPEPSLSCLLFDFLHGCHYPHLHGRIRPPSR